MFSLRGLLGGGEEQSASSDADVIDKLVERVDSSDILEDRRDALKALRSIAKSAPVYVAKQGLRVFLAVLDSEPEHSDCISAVLDILCIILGDVDEAEDNDNFGELFADTLLAQPKFMPSIMALITVNDFSVRKSFIQLLTTLLRHRGAEVQSAIFNEPQSIVMLTEFLREDQEILRNSAVLMMSELSRANTEIQQLLAYQDVFNHLFYIIGTEHFDSIVIEDCLFVMLNLLRKNSSNQQHFREAGFIPRLAALLNSFLNPGQQDIDYDPNRGEWPKQKIANVIFILQVIRSLVSPSDNVQSYTHAAQKAVYQTGILTELCQVLLDEKGISMDVLTETVVVVAECIRGNLNNQEYFAKTNLIVEGGSRSYLLVLLMSMTAENQPVKLRCAVFYCFISYLHDNSLGKMMIIETLTSPTDRQGDLTTGQCLCNAAMSTESLQVWFGSVALMHCLLEEDDLKNKLLLVQLTTSADQPHSTLLSHLTGQLISYGNRRPQVRAAILMLLSVWMFNCPQAVGQLLAKDENVTYLTSQINESGAEGSESENQVVRGLVAFLLGICMRFQSRENGESRNTLWDLLERRIQNARETFTERLEGVSKSEQYVRAAQKPQPLARSHSDLLLDYQFTKLFKVLEGDMLKMVQPGGDSWNPMQNNENIVLSFKELIRKQDAQISALTQQVKKLTVELDKTQALKEQNRSLEEDVNRMRDEASKKVSQNENIAALTLQLESATTVGQQWQTEACKYKNWAEQWQNFQVGQHGISQDAVVQQLQAQLSQTEQQLQFGWQAYEQQTQQVTSKTNYYMEKIRKLEEDLSNAETQTSSKMTNGVLSPDVVHDVDSEEIAQLRTEQEDLLLLLADQNSKISQYRRRLLELGDDVTDDEVTDDEDEH